MPLGGVFYHLFVPFWEIFSETIEKFTFSYTFLYCEKQFRYLILVCMFPIAGACAEFSCRPEIRRVALLPFLYTVTRGTNWVYSLDGHAKLMGYQRDTFPIAIYGCIDTASRKLLWIQAWTSNPNPELVGRRWRLYKGPELWSLVSYTGDFWGSLAPQKFYCPLRWPTFSRIIIIIIII